VTYSEQLERDAAASLERWKASGRIPDTESPKDKAEREAYLRSPEAAAERARTAVENERGDSGVPAGSFSVDRFEGDKAVLVNEDGDTKVVLRSKLGPGVRPGHVLRGDLTADEAATKKVEDDTAAVQKRLKRE